MKLTPLDICEKIHRLFRDVSVGDCFWFVTSAGTLANNLQLKVGDHQHFSFASGNLYEERDIKRPVVMAETELLFKRAD